MFIFFRVLEQKLKINKLKNYIHSYSNLLMHTESEYLLFFVIVFIREVLAWKAFVEILVHFFHAVGAAMTGRPEDLTVIFIFTRFFYNIFHKYCLP